MIVQGFGNVGSNAARLMAEAGYKIIGIIEVGGGLYNKNGIDMEALWEFPPAQWNDSGFPGRRLRSCGAVAGRLRHPDSGGDGKPDHQPEMRIG